MFSQKKDSITEISSYSLGVYFLIIVIGVLVDLFLFSQKLFSGDLYIYVGAGILLLGTMIVFWAMYTGGKYRKESHRYDELEHGHLKKGAFRFTRNPNYIGAGVLVLGLGFFTNSFAIVVAAAISFVVVNAWFIPHEEAILAERHGEHFDTYKETTRKWF